MSPITALIVGFGIVLAAAGLGTWIAFRSIKDERQQKMQHH